MTIAKGTQWGEPGEVPENSIVCRSDADTASTIRGAVCILTTGDLWRGLGEPGPKVPHDECTILRVDVLEVTLDMIDGTSTRSRAVAHVCLGRFGSRKGFCGVVNAGFVDGANLAPRGHPGDGRVEFVTMDAGVSWRQRRMARKRAITGTHLPHPSIRVETVTTWSAETDGETLRVDGVVIPGVRHLSVTIGAGQLAVAV